MADLNDCLTELLYFLWVIYNLRSQLLSRLICEGQLDEQNDLWGLSSEYRSNWGERKGETEVKKKGGVLYIAVSIFHDLFQHGAEKNVRL